MNYGSKSNRLNAPKGIPLEHHLELLEAIGQNPQVTQADLAAQLGVAVGTVNWYLKRLITRGFVKIRRLQRKRLLYLITPRGITEKSRLAVLYMRASLQVYHEARAQAVQLLEQTRQAGFRKVVVEGDGDLAEICRLTCLEQGLKVAHPINGRALPHLRADGTRLTLMPPEIEPDSRKII